MAFKQLLNTCTHKFMNQTSKRCLISSSSSSTVQSLTPPNPDVTSSPTPEPKHDSIFRKLLHRRPPYLSSPANLPELLRPGGEKLSEKLREINNARNLIRLRTGSQFTAGDVKKIVRVSKLKMLKSKLKGCGKNHVGYDEFIQMCVDECCDRDEGLELAGVLENSGSVIVLGNVVFLKPAQVLKAINGLMTVDDVPVKELKEMERLKSEIDRKATKIVRRELWGGLGYLVVQTAVFIRLTFWELSWDVMEPICVYLTSLYFMVGFAYFIRTSREPSFEAVFQSRFRVKQTKLMKIKGFDVEKYNELKKSCGFHATKLMKVEGFDVEKSNELKKSCGFHAQQHR